MTIEDYDNIIKYLFGFELVTDYSLEKVRYCAKLLGNPQDSCKIIHITGTNGKGSTCNMCFSILKKRGKKVGIFTSPHLIDIRERFKTQNGMISQKDLMSIVNKIIALQVKLSYFEKCTLIAFEYFRQQGCEYAVIEVGVGGLLDSTNIVNPIITGITSLGYDHIDLLGTTLDDIAFQKAGIIKPGIPFVINFHNQVIKLQADQKGSPIIFTDKKINTNLIGDYQQYNAAIAYEIGKYIGISEKIIIEGLQHVSHPGRLDYLMPNLLIDGAHNDQGLESLQTYLNTIKHNFSQIVYCFSIKKGKEEKIQEYIIDRFGSNEEYTIIDYYHNLLAQTRDISTELRSIIHNVHSPDEIKSLAKENKNILYVVFGSLYMIGGFY